MADRSKDIYYTENLDVPETPGPGIPPAPWRSTRVVGKPLPRVDAYERVSGSAVYPSDVAFVDMLYGAIVRCPHPNARVKRVSTGKAEAIRGVRRVLTASSPGADLVWPYGGSGNESKLFDPHCRFEGDVVAAVAAETPYVAADAVRAMAVDYEVLPFVVDETKALEEGAPKVHDGGNRVKDAEIYARGDVDQGFKAADVVVERTFHTACELHTPLELHGCVAKWDGDKLTVWESTQGVYGVQSVLASVLGLPLSRIRVVGHYMGGGFGAKLRPGKYAVIAALLAKQTGRPVKVFVDREASFLAVGNRPPATMTLRAGAKKDGTLTALQFRGLGTGGAYAAGGTSRIDWLVRDLYLCPNVRTETQDVFINAGPARPFRAPGHPQSAWALEQILDELAIKLGMDAVALRLKNISDKSQAREGNPPYTTTGLRRCLEEGAKQFGWEASRRRAEETHKSGHVRRGVGMASCLWVTGGGGPPSTVLVKVFADGSVNLTMGASDIGTGTKSVMAMVVSEELGIRPEFIQIEHADTGTTQYATPSGGSKTVPTEAPAVRAAAIDARRQLLEMASEDLAVPAAQLRMEAGEVTTKDGKRLPILKIERLKKRQSVVGVGYRGPNPEGKVVNPFAAQFCEVEVNTLTGELRILRFLGAHDSGRVMNRLTYDNQVFGGIVMGIGYATTEERVLDGGQTGKMLNRNWHDYKLPTALDVPADMTCVPVDPGDQEANTVGAKGLGEPATIPTAAAIANAIFHATGVRVTDTPVNPVRLNQLLMERDKEG
jgi:xanthine dehydrogenase YagR molybdenum-binding subunit